MSAPSQQQPSLPIQHHPNANGTYHTSMSGLQASKPNIMNGILLPPTTASSPVSASPPPQPIAPMDKSKAAQKAKETATTAAEGETKGAKPKQVRKKRGYYKKTLLRMQAEAEAKARAAEIARAEAEGRVLTETSMAGVPTSSTVTAPAPPVHSTTQLSGSQFVSSAALHHGQQPEQQQPQQHQLQQQQASPQLPLRSSPPLPLRHDSPPNIAKPSHPTMVNRSEQPLSIQGAGSAVAHKSRLGHTMAAQESVSGNKSKVAKSTTSSKGKEHPPDHEWDDWIHIKEEHPIPHHQSAPKSMTSRTVENLGIKSSKHLQSRQHKSSHHQQHQPQSPLIGRAGGHAFSTTQMQSQSQTHNYLNIGLDRDQSQVEQEDADDDDEDEEDEENHDTRADLEEELAMLAQEAADERKRQKQRDLQELERAQKTAQAVSLLRDLKSKLRGATEVLGQSLQFQSGDMISQIFDEVLDDIGRDNLEMLKSLTEKRLNQQEDEYASILTSPEHADHIVTRSAVAAQLHGGERPTKHDLVSRRGRTKPHTVVRRPPEFSHNHNDNQSQPHHHKTSQLAMEESDAGSLGDYDDDYSRDQYIGQAWEVHAGDEEASSSSALRHHPASNSNGIGSTGMSKRSHINHRRSDHFAVTRPKKLLKTLSSSSFSPSDFSSPSDAIRMFPIAEEELRRQQTAEFEALQRKHFGEFQELQRWMYKQHEEFQNIEFSKTRHIREQFARLPPSSPSSSQGGANARGWREASLARQLTFGNRQSSHEYDESDTGHQSPDHSSPPRSPTPPPVPPVRTPKKSQRDSTITTTSTTIQQQKPSASSSSSSAIEFDQDRLIRASQQAGFARTPSSSSLKLNGVHHKLSKQMLKNRDGLPMSTMNLALTAMSEKRKLLKRASKLSLGTAQPLSEEHDDYDDDSDDLSGILQNGYRHSSPPTTRPSAATRGGGGIGSTHRPSEVAPQARTIPIPKRASEMLPVDLNSPFLVHNGTGSRSSSIQSSSRSAFASHVTSPSPAPMSPPPAQSRKATTGASKKRKTSSSGSSSAHKHEPGHPPQSSPTRTNDGNNLNHALLNHYSQQWKSDSKTENLFDLMLSDPPEFDIDESEVESMLVSNVGPNEASEQHGNSSRVSSKRKELNSTPTSNAFKWYQKQQRLAEDLARQPKMAPLQLNGLADDDSTANLTTPFDFAALVGQTNGGIFTSDSQGDVQYTIPNGADGNNNDNNNSNNNNTEADPSSSASLLPLDYIPVSSPISPAMDMLFSEDGQNSANGSAMTAEDWGFKAFSGTVIGDDLTDEFLHPESPGGGGSHSLSHNFLDL